MKPRDVIKQRERRREARASRALDRALSEAKVHAPGVSLADLAQMASSNDASARLLALMIARRKIGSGDPPIDYFEFARGLVRDRDNVAFGRGFWKFGRRGYEDCNWLCSPGASPRREF